MHRLYQGAKEDDDKHGDSFDNGFDDGPSPSTDFSGSCTKCCICYRRRSRPGSRTLSVGNLRCGFAEAFECFLDRTTVSARKLSSGQAGIKQEQRMAALPIQKYTTRCIFNNNAGTFSVHTIRRADGGHNGCVARLHSSLQMLKSATVCPRTSAGVAFSERVR